MSKVVFTGCSFTAGVGWVQSNDRLIRNTQGKYHPSLWVNLCHSQIDQLNNLELVNLGQAAASNADIFRNTVDAIATHGSDIKVLFCQWTTGPRYRFRTGSDAWHTFQSLSPTARGQDKDQTYINDVLDRFLALHNLHDEILKVIEFVNVLKKLAQQLNIKLYNINGLCPWDADYFVRLKNATPADYTTFTREKILDIDNKSNEDINKLYQIIHDEYDAAGGVDPPTWVNLYNSFKLNLTDTNFDLMHPGT